MEPPNDGQVGASILVHYLEIVLYWVKLVKKSYMRIECHIGKIYSRIQHNISMITLHVLTNYGFNGLS